MTSLSLENSRICFALSLVPVFNPGHILMAVSLILGTCVSLVDSLIKALDGG